MKQTINNRLTALRSFMKEHSLDAFIIPNTDPHLSEYTASHWKSRQWISGFTGSAGTVVVTASRAGLWTDSRYFLQAEQQLEGTGIKLFKEGLSETPSIAKWLCQILKENSCVGIDGLVFAVNTVEALASELNKYHIRLDTQHDPMDTLWSNRPPMPQSTAYVHPLQYAGIGMQEKVSQIRNAIEKNKAEAILLSALDEIAWTLNLRGNDIECNPLVVSYLLITQTNIIYFISPQKLTMETSEYLQREQVSIMNYNKLRDYLAECDLNSIQLTPTTTNYGAFSAIAPSCRIIRADSPVSLLKSIKNEQEINGVKNAMIRDGVALVRFLRKLEYSICNDTESELSASKMLYDIRAEQPLFKGDSFKTIAGYKEHAAIVHYSATAESNIALKPEGFLLLDSGAQYADATTDITRTIMLGPLSEEERFDYTAVLKGHINLALCQFPKGTRGAQLDVLARCAMWKAGMNYLHGTGHGVGSFLCVHEGPQSIRMNENPTVLQPGMITSNEPGIYKSNRHGIRIENLMLVVEGQTTEFGTFYQFETITLCPIDTAPIVRDMLTKEETEWLNSYHQMVFEKLSPHLTEKESNWLKAKTTAI